MSAGIRIILYFLFAVSLFFINNPLIYLYMLFPFLFLLFIVPFRQMKRGWLPIGIILFFTFLSNALFQHGKIIYSGPVTLTDEGLNSASVRTLRVFFMIAGAKVLTATTESDALTKAMERMFSPLEKIGVPVKAFFQITGLTIKSLPVIRDRISALYRESSGKYKNAGFTGRVQRFSSFVMALFIQSLKAPEEFIKNDKDKT